MDIEKVEEDFLPRYFEEEEDFLQQTVEIPSLHVRTQDLIDKLSSNYDPYLCFEIYAY
jgi:hypothetical protein